jgi:hypothetical protein
MEAVELTLYHIRIEIEIEKADGSLKDSTSAAFLPWQDRAFQQEGSQSAFRTQVS